MNQRDQTDQIDQINQTDDQVLLAPRAALATRRIHRLVKGVGASLEIWLWAQQGARGKPTTWQLRREAL